MRMCSPSRRRGAAAAELAVLLPFLLFLLVITIDYGRVFYFALTINNCARNGALYGCADSVHATDTVGIRKAALADSGNLSPQPTVTSTTGNDGSGDPYVEVTCKWQFQTLLGYPGIPKTVDLVRTARMRVAPEQPLDQPGSMTAGGT